MSEEPTVDQVVDFVRQRIAERTDAAVDAVQANSILVDLGLESLDAVLLCGAVEDHFGVEVDPAAIFENETLEDFARAVLERREH